MANSTITSLPSAGGIDPINDFLVIDTASPSATNRINRNTLMGITGTPLGTSDTQTVSAKTFNNTNIYTIKDGNLTIQNTTDVTKQVVFNLGGLTTGTTRTLSLPNSNGTLATLTGVETLSSKTLNSPVINAGTIDNATVTVDSIAGHTTSTIVTVAGVQMNNGTIGTAGAVTSTSIAAGAVTPNALVAAAGTGWAWQSWTPTWANLTTGNGTNSSFYTQIGKTVICLLQFTFGTTSAMGSNPTFTLPVTASAHPSTSLSPYIGQVRLLDSGIAAYVSQVAYLSTTTAGLFAVGTGGAIANETGISSTVPFTWGLADGLAGFLTYEAA